MRRRGVVRHVSRLFINTLNIYVMANEYKVVKNGKEIMKYYGDNPFGAVCFAEGYVRALVEAGARIETPRCQPIDGYKWYGDIELSVQCEGHVVNGKDF